MLNPDIEYFDLRNKFPKQNETLYRYGETRELEYPDVVHLSNTGFFLFKKSFFFCDNF